MKYIILSSPGSNTQIQLDSENNPIWDYFSEPTLSILQLAYEEQKDNLQVFELVLEPIEVTPDWQGFINACDAVELGGNGLFQKLLVINFDLSMHIYNLLLRLKDNNSELEIRTVNFLYSQILPLLEEKDKTDLAATGVAHNIPIAF